MIRRADATYDKPLIVDIFSQILTAISRIERRFEIITYAEDFKETDEGEDRFDAICLMLLAIGESLVHIDKTTKESLLNEYPEGEWAKMKNVSDKISHHYFDVDIEEVHYICSHHIQPLKTAVQIMSSDLKS